MEVVKALWDSWAADAVIDDQAAGLRATRAHPAIVAAISLIP